MIHKSQWVSDRLTELAHDILNDKLTLFDGAESLAAKIDIQDKPLALEVITDKCKSWIKQEMHSLVRAATRIVGDEERAGQGALFPLPFPWLPAYLEIAPGRTVHQRVMTGPDWDHAKAIWQNRFDQAAISLEGFRRAYEMIRGLLPDETTMTGDVIDHLPIDGDDESGEAEAL
jgi:hypothetical protein